MILVFLAVIIFNELYNYFAAFLGAITLYVLLRNPLRKLNKKYNVPILMITLVLMLLSFVVLVIPLSWMTYVAIDKLKPIIQDPTQITSVFETIHEYLATKFKIDILNEQNVQKISEQLIPFAKNTIGSTLTVLANIGIMYLILFFMLNSHEEMERNIRKIIPLRLENSNLLISESKNLVYSNAVGIPLVAFVQGFVGLVGYYIFQVEDALLMGLLTAIASVVPVVGSLMVYFPLAIYMLSQGMTWQGIGILFWGFLIIGSVDNIARFLIQKKMADVHPLITIFGVIIGINLFGFMGVIFGPFMLSIFVLMTKIYLKEFGKTDLDEHNSTL